MGQENVSNSQTGPIRKPILRQFSDENDHVRINAIIELGEMGDELCLKELRERLKYLF